MVVSHLPFFRTREGLRGSNFDRFMHFDSLKLHKGGFPLKNVYTKFENRAVFYCCISREIKKS